MGEPAEAPFFYEKSSKKRAGKQFRKIRRDEIKGFEKCGEKKAANFSREYFCENLKNDAAKEMQKNAAARTVGFGKNAFSVGLAFKRRLFCPLLFVKLAFCEEFDVSGRAVFALPHGAAVDALCP